MEMNTRLDTAHTPGPWLLTSDHGMVYALTQDGWWKGEPRMCNRFDASIHRGKDCSAEEHFANVALIAAAPDLLAALQSLAHIVQDEYGFGDNEPTDEPGRRNEYVKARAAIAKALGK